MCEWRGFYLHQLKQLQRQMIRPIRALSLLPLRGIGLSALHDAATELVIESEGEKRAHPPLNQVFGRKVARTKRIVHGADIPPLC